jgi:hypothetical protein
MNREAARFQTVADDMLVVVADSTMNCPLGSVWRLDLHRGRKGNVGRGALFGGLIGAAVGLGAGVSMQVEDFNAGAFTAAGALAGVLIGVPVGAFIKSDRWEEVPLDQLRVQPVATPGGGLGLAASLKF